MCNTFFNFCQTRNIFKDDTGPGKSERPRATSREAFQINPGDDLLSHPVAQAVSSALEGLTSVFEMGTGVTPPP